MQECAQINPIEKHLQNIQVLWMMFTIILIITIQKKRKILIVSDDMTADISNNKKYQSIITELFIRCRQLNISLVFITQSYFIVPKDVRLNSTH